MSKSLRDYEIELDYSGVKSVADLYEFIANSTHKDELEKLKEDLIKYVESKK